MRIGEVAKKLGLSVSQVRKLADAGSLPSERSSGGHRLFELAAVREALLRNPPPSVKTLPPDLIQQRSTVGLEEHLVWNDASAHLHLQQRVSDGCWGVLQYAFSEMVNNAIDHSGAPEVVSRWWVDEATVTFEVRDLGGGAFATVRHGLLLDDLFAAVQELSKGKTTTDPQRHTGEGIFFTSKVVDVFTIEANGLRWTIDNIRGDQAVGVSSRIEGTLVRCEVDAQTTRTTGEVFAEYSIDHDFLRTRTAVSLFGIGVRFVSRSEARRLLAGLERFDEIVIDFRGVVEVGQGFVDEVFRVWPEQHPGHTVEPANMAGPVEAMVRRGLPVIRGDRPPAR